MSVAAEVLRKETTFLEEVDRRLEEVLGAIYHPRFRGIARESAEGGKRIRPLLTSLSCEAAGGEARQALDAAVAVELLHVASLVHDDIMDHASTRRGRPTVVSAHGVPAAILSGDLLLAAAFRLIHHSHIGRNGEAGRILSSAFFDLCEGQACDLLPLAGAGTERDLHRSMVEQKTARLLGAASALGGICAGAKERHVQALGLFGLHLGMAYQAQDDLLDVAGDEAAAGKTLRIDGENGRTTYLSVAYGRPDPSEEVREEIAFHTETARRALDVLPPSAARETLRALAKSLMNRTA
jgi:geranylgeranyl pyrophosphate synthase